MIHKYTWNWTLGILILTPLNWQTAWRHNNNLKLNPDKMEILVIGDDKIRSFMK